VEQPALRRLDQAQVQRRFASLQTAFDFVIRPHTLSNSRNFVTPDRTCHNANDTKNRVMIVDIFAQKA
jgi:hypothetical protein